MTFLHNKTELIANQNIPITDQTIKACYIQRTIYISNKQLPMVLHNSVIRDGDKSKNLKHFNNPNKRGILGTPVMGWDERKP